MCGGGELCDDVPLANLERVLSVCGPCGRLDCSVLVVLGSGFLAVSRAGVVI